MLDVTKKNIKIIGKCCVIDKHVFRILHYYLNQMVCCCDYAHMADSLKCNSDTNDEETFLQGFIDWLWNVQKIPKKCFHGTV